MSNIEKVALMVWTVGVLFFTFFLDIFTTYLLLDRGGSEHWDRLPELVMNIFGKTGPRFYVVMGAAKLFIYGMLWTFLAFGLTSDWLMKEKNKAAIAGVKVFCYVGAYVLLLANVFACLNNLSELHS